MSSQKRDTTTYMPESKKHRILIVEDNEDAASACQELLCLSGYDAKVAHNGEDGLALALQCLPDVILCDLSLPCGVSGFDFARMARKHHVLHNSFLIAVTGYLPAEAKSQAEAAGFDHFLSKPIDLDALQQVIQSTCSKQPL